MAWIHSQDNASSMYVDGLKGLRGEVLRTESADTGDEFYLVELTKSTWTPEAPTEFKGLVLYGGLYRTRGEAEAEFVRLGRLLIHGDKSEHFWFKPSDIRPLELVRLKTAFI